MSDETVIDHRPDCQLLTVPVYGLCTCDFDQRKRVDEAMRTRTTPFPSGDKIITESNP